MFGRKRKKKQPFKKKKLSFDSGFDEHFYENEREVDQASESWKTYKKICEDIKSYGDIVIVGLSDGGLNDNLEHCKTMLNEIFSSKFIMDKEKKEARYIIPFYFVTDNNKILINNFFDVQHINDDYKNGNNYLSGYDDCYRVSEFVSKKNIEPNLKGINKLRNDIKESGKHIMHIHKMSSIKGLYVKLCIILFYRLFLVNHDEEFSLVEKTYNIIITFFPPLLVPIILTVSQEFYAAFIILTITVVIFSLMFNSTKKFFIPLKELNKDHNLIFSTFNKKIKWWMKCVMKVFSFNEKSEAQGIVSSNYFLYPASKRNNKKFVHPFYLPNNHFEWGITLINQIVRNLKYKHWNLPFYECFYVKKFKTDFYEYVKQVYNEVISELIVSTKRYDKIKFDISKMKKKQRLGKSDLSEDELVFTILSEITYIANANRYSICRLWKEDILKMSSNAEARKEIAPLGNTIYLVECNIKSDEVIELSVELTKELQKKYEDEFIDELKIRLICICIEKEELLNKYKEHQTMYVEYANLIKGSESTQMIRQFEKASREYSYDFSLLQSEQEFQELMKYQYMESKTEENDYSENGAKGNVSEISRELVRDGFRIDGEVKTKYE